MEKIIGLAAVIAILAIGFMADYIFVKVKYGRKK